jgi:hypothetical protein
MTRLTDIFVAFAFGMSPTAGIGSSFASPTVRPSSECLVVGIEFDLPNIHRNRHAPAELNQDDANFAGQVMKRHRLRTVFMPERNGIQERNHDTLQAHGHPEIDPNPVTGTEPTWRAQVTDGHFVASLQNEGRPGI